MKRKIYQFLLIAATVILSACSSDEADFLNNAEQSLKESLAANDVSLVMDSLLNPTDLEETPELKELKEKMKELKNSRLKSASSYDYDYQREQYLSEELYSLREIPIYLIAKESNWGKNTLTTQGKGKEIIFDNFGGGKEEQKFYIKVLPASTGIPYLIYSYKEKTPVSVGSYSNTPDKKVLFVRSDTNIPYGCSWNFMYGKKSEASFIIESQDYISSGGSSWWDVYNNVIGVKDNLLMWGRYNNQKNQEFDIMPVEEFRVKQVRFINDNTTTLINKPERAFKTYYTNNGPVEQTKTLKIADEVTETSNFQNKTSTSFSLKTTTTCKVPFFAKGEVETNSTLGTEFTFGESESKKRAISHDFPLKVPAYHHAECTIFLSQYEADVEFEAIAEGVTSKREIKIRGRWNGVSFSEDRTVVDVTPINNPAGKRSITIKGVPKTIVSF